MNFDESFLERYSRNILLQEVGIEGQQKIREASILVIGAGGLGSPILLYLAAAGVGRLGIVDFDKVDLTNLQRQIIHFTPDIGKPKTLSAKEKILALNPTVEVETYNVLLTSENIREIIRKYDFVIDGTDNFRSKFLINDACYFEKKPLSHGGILRFLGQTMTILPGESACYRCIFDAPPPPNAVPTCSQAGILGSVAGILGTIQATEALKFIIGFGELLTNTLLTFDAKTFLFRKIKLSKQKKCRLCGEKPTITELFDEADVVCDIAKKE
ncbi:HesA/MoeB/ThiF family protein [Thermospira aquatica]|uniref:HesA/MoeB/ThiF family protein n=1 Tax=Thermospira aquatica TaxID=2828656 RepID=UPI0038CD7CC4